MPALEWRAQNVCHPGNSGAKEWKVVNSLTTTAAHSPGAWLTINLGSHAPFTRESPKTMDPQVLEDFRESFNLLQNVPTSAETSDIFMSDSSQVRLLIMQQCHPNDRATKQC
jgi:hypothetical protein